MSQCSSSVYCGASAIVATGRYVELEECVARLLSAHYRERVYAVIGAHTDCDRASFEWICIGNETLRFSIGFTSSSLVQSAKRAISLAEFFRDSIQPELRALKVERRSDSPNAGEPHELRVFNANGESLHDVGPIVIEQLGFLATAQLETTDLPHSADIQYVPLAIGITIEEELQQLFESGAQKLFLSRMTITVGDEMGAGFLGNVFVSEKEFSVLIEEKCMEEANYPGVRLSLGTLEIPLPELMRLRVGSTISFPKPQVFEGELLMPGSGAWARVEVQLGEESVELTVKEVLVLGEEYKGIAQGVR